MADPHETNRRYWDAQAEGWRELRDRDGLWRICAERPEVAFEGRALEMIRAYAGDLKGKRACVIGSGDNYAAFALAGLGAHVNSTDISQRQLDIAWERAKEIGLAPVIDFVRADAADLAPLPDAGFDLVCSSNGLFVWIANPAAVFAAVHRVLKPGGHSVFYDIHPFQRPWRDQVQPLEMAKSYWDTGPYYEEDRFGDGASAGTFGSYEHHWTLADLLNPLAESGLTLKQIAESPARDPRFWEGHAYEPGVDGGLTDWRHNPRAGLPVWLTVCAQKPRA